MKRFFTLTAGLLLACTTLTPALAYDWGDYARDLQRQQHYNSMEQQLQRFDRQEQLRQGQEMNDALRSLDTDQRWNNHERQDRQNRPLFDGGEE